MIVFSWSVGPGGTSSTFNISKHDVTPAEAEHVVRHARPPFPRKIGNDKWQAWGRTREGRYLQVIYAEPAEDEIDIDSLSDADLIAYSDGQAAVLYVIHAMDLTDEQKRYVRRR